MMTLPEDLLLYLVIGLAAAAAGATCAGFLVLCAASVALAQSRRED